MPDSDKLAAFQQEALMRGRKAAIIESIRQYDFDKLSKTQGHPRERKRYLAFSQTSEGKSFTDSAAAVRIRIRTLMNWIKRFRTQGIDGLLYRPGRGAKPYLSKRTECI